MDKKREEFASSPFLLLRLTYRKPKLGFFVGVTFGCTEQTTDGHQS